MRLLFKIHVRLTGRANGASGGDEGVVNGGVKVGVG